MNLLKETKEVLKTKNKNLSDIMWFGSREVVLTGDIEKAISFDYDNGFGVQEVFEDLILVGKDFWLERHEYDGSEWWEYKEMPKKPIIKVELGLRNLKRGDEIRNISDHQWGDTLSLVKKSEIDNINK